VAVGVEADTVAEVGLLDADRERDGALLGGDRPGALQGSR
jgi:hypothetical protein